MTGGPVRGRGRDRAGTAAAAATTGGARTRCVGAVADRRGTATATEGAATAASTGVRRGVVSAVAARLPAAGKAVAEGAVAVHTTGAGRDGLATLATAHGAQRGRRVVEAVLSIGAHRHDRGAGQAAIAAEPAVAGVAAAAAAATAGQDQALSGHVEVGPAAPATARVNRVSAGDRATVTAAVAAPGEAHVAGRAAGAAAAHDAGVGLSREDCVGGRTAAPAPFALATADRAAARASAHRSPHRAGAVGHRARVGPGRGDDHRTRDSGGTRRDRLLQCQHDGGHGEQARGGDGARQTAAGGGLAHLGVASWAARVTVPVWAPGACIVAVAALFNIDIPVRRWVGADRSLSESSAPGPCLRSRLWGTRGVCGEVGAIPRTNCQGGANCPVSPRCGRGPRGASAARHGAAWRRRRSGTRRWHGGRRCTCCG